MSTGAAGSLSAVLDGATPEVRAILDRVLDDHELSVGDALTLDHINPEKPWPLIGDLRRATESEGFAFRERLAVYPAYATRAEFLDESLRARVAALVDADGLVKESHEHWRRW